MERGGRPARRRASLGMRGEAATVTTKAIPQTSRLHYGWVILIMGTLVVFGALGLARFGYSVILPSMQAGLGLNNQQAGGLATANLIGYVIFSAAGGALSSRYGPRRVIALGLVVAGLGMLLTGLASNFLTAATWRLLTGIGTGASNVPVMGLLAAWFVARRRGLASGIAVAGSSIGLIVVGPLVPRILAAYGASGWRQSWFLFGAITLVLAVLAYLVLRDRPGEAGLHAVGDETRTVAPRPAPGGSGLQWGRVYRSVPVWHLGLVYIAFGFSYIIYMTFFAKALIGQGGYSTGQAGNLFMVMGWTTTLSGLIWGTVSDHTGRKRAMILVYLIQTVAYALFALWQTPAGFTLSAILFGLTAWSLPAIMAATCGDVLGPRLAPAALGFITIFFGLGQALGPVVAGGMADAAGNSFTGAYLLAAVVALLGAGGAALLRPASTARELTEV